MHFVVFGAGALGCFYGGWLQQGGHDVTFIARGAHLDAMRATGLRLETASGVVQLDQVRATSDISEVAKADVVFYAVKNYDVGASLSGLANILKPDTAIVTVQNGVSAQPILAQEFGAHHVFPGAVRLPADIRSPGVVRTHAVPDMGGLVFGPYGGGASQRANAIGDAFAESGVATEVSEDIWLALWEKFIPLSAFSALTVAARLDIGAVRTCDESRDLLRQLIDETSDVARASHPTVPDDAAQSAFDFLMGVPPNIHASMLDDLLRGRRIELDWLSGEVIRRARHLGLATPAHAFAYALLAPFRDGRPEGSHFGTDPEP